MRVKHLHLTLQYLNIHTKAQNTHIHTKTRTHIYIQRLEHTHTYKCSNTHANNYLGLAPKKKPYIFIPGNSIVKPPRARAGNTKLQNTHI